MTPEGMAALHAGSFAGPARWSAQSFSALLEDPQVFRVARPSAFLLARVVLEEVELLTLLVDPGARGRGIGRALLTAFDAEAGSRGAREAFLEVAADNSPARALYDRTGWTQVGQRPGYYDGTDALILRKPL